MCWLCRAADDTHLPSQRRSYPKATYTRKFFSRMTAFQPCTRTECVKNDKRHTTTTSTPSTYSSSQESRFNRTHRYFIIRRVHIHSVSLARALTFAPCHLAWWRIDSRADIVRWSRTCNYRIIATTAHNTTRASTTIYKHNINAHYPAIAAAKHLFSRMRVNHIRSICSCISVAALVRDCGEDTQFLRPARIYIKLSNYCSLITEWSDSCAMLIDK